MTDEKTYQLQNLRKIYEDASRSPFFKTHDIKLNALYSGAGAPRIAYSDIMDNKYIIREALDDNFNAFWDGKGEIIAEYQSLEDLVDAGWRLD